MAKLLGVLAMPFNIMYPDKAKEMKRMALDYIKVLRRTHLDNSQDAGGFQRNTLQIDTTGFPVAPWPQSWTKVTRANLELKYQLYMTCHYHKSHYFY